MASVLPVARAHTYMCVCAMASAYLYLHQQLNDTPGLAPLRTLTPCLRLPASLS